LNTTSAHLHGRRTAGSPGANRSREMGHVAPLRIAALCTRLMNLDF
jgi:hypothetical protein